MCLDLADSIRNKYLKPSKYLSSFFLALFLSAPITSNAQENELKPVTFGKQATHYSLIKQERSKAIGNTPKKNLIFLTH